jgi:membrane associated rhomboid family serine protease
VKIKSIMAFTENRKPKTENRQRRGRRPRGWKILALVVIIALAPACQAIPAKVYIPLAYGAAGMCVALLMSPTLTAALVGLGVGLLLGAAVYNNSLKRQLPEQQKRK